MINGSAKILNYGQPINWQAPLNRGLVGWWMTLPQRPARAKGVFRNLVGRNHATCGTTIGIDGHKPTRAMAHGSCLKMDGTSGSSTVVDGSAYSFGASSFSFGMWVKATTATTNLSLAARSGSTAQGFDIIHNQGANVVGPRIGTSVSNYQPTYQTLTNGTWGYVFGVVNQSTGSFRSFLNGTFRASSAFSGTIANTQTLRFGDRGGLYFTGSVNDCRIYNRALSDDEVLQLFKASRTGYDKELN